ncbi:hypothetical protein G4Y73_00340 [Wenzhouxiangella sp. XN201]|uniref:hypothetical protein n=1 Tax=Wenzhouxiangella sp. XN201 TaxID=2710755 RepID=UPI0013CB5EB5|nr:hypothetical protein [Wenzhouxiangella sp. XN201]NEZ02592.1 hypothetical protein [Wenzhouxiangella sp. XN201]
MTAQPARQPNIPPWRLVALALYPVLIYLSLHFQQPALRSACLPLLALLLLGLFPSWPARALVMTIALALAAVALFLPGLALWPPGLIFVGLAVWFATTLRPGQTPVIERFAVLVHARNGTVAPSGATGWLWHWTLAWAVVLATIGAIALYLAWYDLSAAWLAWVVIAAPAIMLATLWSELLLRRRRFPDETHPGLFRFLIDVVRIQPRHVAR